MTTCDHKWECIPTGMVLRCTECGERRFMTTFEIAIYEKGVSDGKRTALCQATDAINEALNNLEDKC